MGKRGRGEDQRHQMQTLRLWLCYIVGLFVCMVLTFFVFKLPRQSWKIPTD